MSFPIMSKYTHDAPRSALDTLIRILCVWVWTFWYGDQSSHSSLREYIFRDCTVKASISTLGRRACSSCHGKGPSPFFIWGCRSFALQTVPFLDFFLRQAAIGDYRNFFFRTGSPHDPTGYLTTSYPISLHFIASFLQRRARSLFSP